MGVAQVSGIVLAESAKRKILISMYTPTQVKSSVTGNGRSDKKQIGLMVQRLLDLDAIPKPADAADAIALALCHAWRVRSASFAQSNGKPRKAPKVVRS
jgi:crossover junction endodeoxyribonuclease RuvC